MIISIAKGVEREEEGCSRHVMGGITDYLRRTDRLGHFACGGQDSATAVQRTNGQKKRRWRDCIIESGIDLRVKGGGM